MTAETTFAMTGLSSGFMTPPRQELQPSASCPNELLCRVCGFPLSNPHVMPCCGIDVCKNCTADKLVDGPIRGGNKTKKCWDYGTVVFIKDLIKNRIKREHVDIWKKENPR